MRRNAPRSFEWTDARMPATRRTRDPRGERVRSRRAILSPGPSVVSGGRNGGLDGAFDLVRAHASEASGHAIRVASMGQGAHPPRRHRVVRTSLDTARGKTDNHERMRAPQPVYSRAGQGGTSWPLSTRRRIVLAGGCSPPALETWCRATGASSPPGDKFNLAPMPSVRARPIPSPRALQASPLVRKGGHA
jgi:hypothetical protein